MRRALQWVALVLLLVPARAQAQYPGANVAPAAGFGVSASVSPGTSVNPAVVVTPAANVSAAPAVPPAAGGYGADQSQAYYYLYLSVLYGMQGTYATPEGQAQLARGVTDYFTNGAAATAVPTTGPMANYFTNGAQATTAPTSAIPDYTFSPPLATASPLTVDAGPPPPPPAPVAVQAGAPAEVPAAAPAVETEAVAAEPAYAPAPAYAPEATAIPAPAPPPPTATAVPTTPPAPAPVPTVAPAPAPSPVARISPATIVWPMVGGIAIGASPRLAGHTHPPAVPVDVTVEGSSGRGPDDLAHDLHRRVRAPRAEERVLPVPRPHRATCPVKSASRLSRCTGRARWTRPVSTTAPPSSARSRTVPVNGKSISAGSSVCTTTSTRPLGAIPEMRSAASAGRSSRSLSTMTMPPRRVERTSVYTALSTMAVSACAAPPVSTCSSATTMRSN